MRIARTTALVLVAVFTGVIREATAQDSAVVAPDTGRTAIEESGRRPSPRDAIGDARQAYERTGIARTVQAGDVLVVPFGHGQPTLTCTPLRLCLLELEPGEVILAKGAGDPVRWIVQQWPAGPDGRTPLLGIKPTTCDITTNLGISTTRRIYEVTLDAPPCGRRAGSGGDGYTRLTTFYYPDDSSPVAPISAPTSEDSAAHNDHVALDHLNFNYHLKKDRHFPWTPTAVFDDGAHTFIRMPPDARHGDAPVLFVLEDNGAKALLNYTISGDFYITDRTFRRGVLVLVDSGKERRVEIENRAFGQGKS
jgi:type IV secretion system protein VirB9